jgi:hypothetical protein
MLQGTWPKGGRPPRSIPYTEEIMSGFEYCAACLMVQSGLLREGFAVLRAAADRYDGRLRHLPGQKENASWGYSGNPFGDDECGKFYARAMAIWGVLVACQGFTYDATTESIGFAPLWKPDDHTSFFTAAEGWGLFEVRGSASKIQIQWGKLRVKTITFAAAKKPSRVQVTLAGRRLPSHFTFAEGQLTVTLNKVAVIAPGQAIEIRPTHS